MSKNFTDHLIITYYDKRGGVIGRHDTEEEDTAENRELWDEFLNDINMSHPGIDPYVDWDQYGFSFIRKWGLK